MLFSIHNGCGEAKVIARHQWNLHKIVIEKPSLQGR